MSPAGEGGPVRTVRDATFDVLRRTGMTTIFANPGSTEVSLLAGFPDDLEFVLALHEGSAGQQDRGHLALEPFLMGRLAGLAGDHPVRVDEPGPPVAPGTAVAVVTGDPAEAHRSPAGLALPASPAE